MRKLLLSLTVLGAFALAFVPTARASTTYQKFDFTSCHISSGCGTSPYGTVELSQNGTSVDVTVTLNPGWSFVNTGAGGSPPQMFKFIGDNGQTPPNLSITMTGTYSSRSHGAVTMTSNEFPSGIDGDGTGLFYYGISCVQSNGSACGNGAGWSVAGPITFTVANATVQSGELVVANGQGISFTADVINTSTGVTGPIDVSGGPVPEPASLLLLGIGLAGIGGLRWRRKREDLT